MKFKHLGINFPCGKCDYKTSEKRQLLQHIKSKHEGVRFPCDQCDFITTWKKYLTTHIKLKHEKKMTSNENLTPLEALILRIDNNEKIPTDELISIVYQIVKS